MEKLEFSKSWRNAADFPTYEPDEAKVRADLQALHDETRDFINDTLVRGFEDLGLAEAAAGIGAKTVSGEASNVQEVLDQLANLVVSGGGSTDILENYYTKLEIDEKLNNQTAIEVLVTAVAAAEITATCNDKTVTAQAGEDGNVTMKLPSYGVWTMTSEGKIRTLNVTVTQQYTVNLRNNIYGVEWDGSSTTRWVRTDDSADFSDPSPAVSNGDGSSPFDELNQALYAEARGDRGGIGGAQYDSIMNTAMQEQAAVNQAQTKLSTDTARQIADLRAQGEFQKADDLLELSQNYLSQLISLQQWALQYNLSVDQFNSSLQQWQQEFELSVGQLMGSYGGSPTLGAQQFEYEKEWNQQQLELSQQQDLQSQLASAGSTLLGAGIMPSDSQLAAMGMDKAQAEAYIKALTIMGSSGGSSGGSGGGSGGSGGSSGSGSSSGSSGSTTGDIYQQMWDGGYRTYSSAYAYLLSQGYTSTEAEKLAGFMEEKVDNGDFFLHQNKVQEAYNLLTGMKLTDEQRKDPNFMALQIGNLAKQASYGLSEADVRALFKMFGYDPGKFM